MKEKTNYNDMKSDELGNRVKSLSDELYAARQKVRTGQFKKFSEFGRMRKEIARVKTHLRALELKSATAKTK
jgi:ribosomal protein L29